MLKFSALSLRRGPRELLRDVSCTIHAGQKIGLSKKSIGLIFGILRLRSDPLHIFGYDLKIANHGAFYLAATRWGCMGFF